MVSISDREQNFFSTDSFLRCHKGLAEILIFLTERRVVSVQKVWREELTDQRSLPNLRLSHETDSEPERESVSERSVLVWPAWDSPARGRDWRGPRWSPSLRGWGSKRSPCYWQLGIWICNEVSQVLDQGTQPPQPDFERREQFCKRKMLLLDNFFSLSRQSLWPRLKLLNWLEARHQTHSERKNLNIFRIWFKGDSRFSILIRLFKRFIFWC